MELFILGAIIIVGAILFFVFDNVLLRTIVIINFMQAKHLLFVKRMQAELRLRNKITAIKRLIRMVKSSKWYAKFTHTFFKKKK